MTSSAVYFLFHVLPDPEFVWLRDPGRAAEIDETEV